MFAMLSFSEIFSELFYFNYRSSNTWCLLDQGVYSIYKGNTHGDGVDHCSTVANSKSSLWLLPLYFVFWSCKVADTWQMVGWRKKTHEVSGILHGFPSFIQSSVIALSVTRCTCPHAHSFSRCWLISLIVKVLWLIIIIMQSNINSTIKSDRLFFIAPNICWMWLIY